jgi:2-polyprenyl-3-methyl-5-hydroxy-6-metoxy-1,4-benzoquinol methylase
MSLLETAIHYLGCPDDNEKLFIDGKFLVCQVCKRKFRILNENTIELLPKNPYKPKLAKSSKQYSEWYPKLLEGDQYSGERPNSKKVLNVDNYDLEMISKIKISQDDIICEVGSGIRSLSLQYAKKAKIVFHTDLDLEDINVARKEAKNKKLENIFFILCNYFNLPFKKKSLPYVICTGILGRHGKEHDEKLLKEITIKLEGKGKFVTTINSKMKKIFFVNAAHQHYGIKKTEIVDLFSKFNCKIVSIEGLAFLPNSRNASKYGYKILNPISKLFFPPSMWLVKITKFELK